jgi:hypothetical protein
MRYCATCGLSVGETATHCQTCGTPTGFVAAGQGGSAISPQAPTTRDAPASPEPAPIDAAPEWGGARWAEPAPPVGSRRRNRSSWFALLVGLGVVAAVVALYLVTGGFGSHDQYTGEWQVVSATENGTASPAPNPALIIEIKRSGDAGGDHDLWFAQQGFLTVDHVGLSRTGGRLYSSLGPGNDITVVVEGHDLTLTETGFNDASVAVVKVLKAVRQ